MTDYDLIDAACLLFIGLAIVVIWWCGVAVLALSVVAACLLIIS